MPKCLHYLSKRRRNQLINREISCFRRLTTLESITASMNNVVEETFTRNSSESFHNTRIVSTSTTPLNVRKCNNLSIEEQYNMKKVVYYVITVLH